MNKTIRSKKTRDFLRKILWPSEAELKSVYLEFEKGVYVDEADKIVSILKIFFISNPGKFLHQSHIAMICEEDEKWVKIFIPDSKKKLLGEEGLCIENKFDIGYRIAEESGVVDEKGKYFQRIRSQCTNLLRIMEQGVAYDFDKLKEQNTDYWALNKEFENTKTSLIDFKSAISRVVDKYKAITDDHRKDVQQPMFKE